MVIGAVSTVAGILIAQFIGAVLISVLLILLAGDYTGLYRVDHGEKKIGQILLVIFALYAPVKVENMILGGEIGRASCRERV